MAVPKKRKPSGRRNDRRAQWVRRAKSARTGPCSQCSSIVLSHAACPVCGTYRGRTVTDIAAREEKRLEKQKQRQREAEEEQRAAAQPAP